MPIQVMVDDSGGKNQGPVLVVGGLIGQAEAWAEFSEKWQSVLDESPKIRFFHMREAAGQSGQFYGFKIPTRNAKVEKLVRVIDEFGFDALHVTVDVGAHANYMTGIGRNAIPTKPYFLAFHHFIKAACDDALDRHATEPFEIFFDEQKSLGLRSKQWYPTLRRMWEITDSECYPLLPVEPFFRNDEEFLPLQAADFVVWFQRRVNSDTPEHDFDFLGDVIKNIGLSRYTYYFGPEQFAKLESHMQDNPITLTPELYAEMDKLLKDDRA